MIKYLGNKEGSKVQIVLLTQPYDGFKGEKEYTYDITAGDQYTIYPFSCGDGTYAIKVFEHLNGTSYAEVFTDEATVVLTNQNLPFLYPNQFVAFGSGDKVVSVGQEAVSTAKKDLDAVANIYHYVSENITYDDAKAELILTKKLESYLPVIDDTLASKTGICFDYAAVMTAMLRSQGIPAKLVIGYSGSVYHAWINVYIQDEGWIDKVIEFNGTDWVLMDPTFNSSLKNPKELNNYIGDGSIYQAMFYY